MKFLLFALAMAFTVQAEDITRFGEEGNFDQNDVFNLPKDEICKIETKNRKAETIVRAVIAAEFGAKALKVSDGGAIPHEDEDKYTLVKWSVFDPNDDAKPPVMLEYSVVFNRYCQVMAINFENLSK